MSRNIDFDALCERYKSFISSEGMKLNDEATGRDEDGDFRLVFKSDGMTYLCYLDKADNEFVRILLPNFYSLETTQEKKFALLAIPTVVKRCKGAKVNFAGENNDDVIASVEFLDKGDSVDSELFLRYVRMVRNGAQEFAKEMSELKKA